MPRDEQDHSEERQLHGSDDGDRDDTLVVSKKPCARFLRAWTRSHRGDPPGVELAGELARPPRRAAACQPTSTTRIPTPGAPALRPWTRSMASQAALLDLQTLCSSTIPCTTAWTHKDHTLLKNPGSLSFGQDGA
jgi:hypothetical protein